MGPTDQADEVLANLDVAISNAEIASHRIYDAFVNLCRRVEELEGINADHQETVATLEQACNQLEADKAMLIRTVTALQAERRVSASCRTIPFAESPQPSTHWMHQTGTK